MDEYIKREDALNALLDEMVGTGYQSRAMGAIKFIPAFDVVPKSEVVKIFEEIDSMIFGTIIPDDCAIISIASLAEIKKKYTGANDEKEKA